MMLRWQRHYMHALHACTVACVLAAHSLIPPSTHAALMRPALPCRSRRSPPASTRQPPSRSATACVPCATLSGCAPHGLPCVDKGSTSCCWRGIGACQAIGCAPSRHQLACCLPANCPAEHDPCISSPAHPRDLRLLRRRHGELAALSASNLNSRTAHSALLRRLLMATLTSCQQ